MKLVGQNDVNQIGVAITNVTGAGTPFSRASRRTRLIGKAAPLFELLLAGLLGLGLIKLTYAVFAPLPVPEGLPVAVAPANDRTAVLRANDSLNPFREVAVEVAANSTELAPLMEDDLDETSLDLSLHGVWADENGGSAIIRTPDGKQQRFVIGDEVWSGVELDGVYLEQVTLRQNGVRETLSMVNRDRETASARRTESRARKRANTQNFNATEINEFVNIGPQRGDNGLELVLNPGSNPELFRRYGLRAGDVLVAVDGKEIGSDFAGAASRFGKLGPGARVQVLVRRDGVSVPLEIRVPNGSEELARGRR